MVEVVKVGVNKIKMSRYQAEKVYNDNGDHIIGQTLDNNPDYTKAKGQEGQTLDFLVFSISI